MRRGIGRLPFLGRRSRRAEPATGESATVRAPIDPDLAPLGPPVLLPRTIIRQVVFDATDFVPAWAMPRAEPAQEAPPIEPKTTKRARRQPVAGTSAAKPAIAKLRGRSRKSNDNPPVPS